MTINSAPPPPTGNDMVYKHSAMQAFPQEIIPHYTTALSSTTFIYKMFYF